MFGFEGVSYLHYPNWYTKVDSCKIVGLTCQSFIRKLSQNIISIIKVLDFSFLFQVVSWLFQAGDKLLEQAAIAVTLL